ncbi:secretagogin-like [Clavelina lepadiformis]|uniref:secretagogin-like n=1 Tax=Clavelina lepadiformis TaxID=159417 RepID=UPI004042CE83
MDSMKDGFINAQQFANIWNQFDLNQSGFIEDHELDAFFYELSKRILKKEPTKAEHADIKASFMSAYNKDGDKRISMSELAKMLLPSDEVFLLLFRRKIPLDSSVTFMQIWRKYDKSCSGYLNVEELKDFIGDYVRVAGANVTPDKLTEYSQSIMKLFDKNHDGQLDLYDMARLINISENFLLQFNIEDSSQEERKRDFEKIFSYYDESRTGALEGAELDGFVKDLMESIKQEPITAQEVDGLKDQLLRHADKNNDGKIQKSELAICLGIHV